MTSLCNECDCDMVVAEAATCLPFTPVGFAGSMLHLYQGLCSVIRGVFRPADRRHTGLPSMRGEPGCFHYLP
jgi:hypothetical protein